MKTKEILGILMLFLCTFSFISCDDDNEQTNELTPEALYQTSWRGTGHCEAWAVQNMGVGMQFVDKKLTLTQVFVVCGRKHTHFI